MRLGLRLVVVEQPTDMGHGGVSAGCHGGLRAANVASTPVGTHHHSVSRRCQPGFPRAPRTSRAASRAREGVRRSPTNVSKSWLWPICVACSLLSIVLLPATVGAFRGAFIGGLVVVHLVLLVPFVAGGHESGRRALTRTVRHSSAMSLRCLPSQSSRAAPSPGAMHAGAPHELHIFAPHPHPTSPHLHLTHPHLHLTHPHPHLTAPHPNVPRPPPTAPHPRPAATHPHPSVPHPHPSAPHHPVRSFNRTGYLWLALLTFLLHVKASAYAFDELSLSAEESDGMGYRMFASGLLVAFSRNVCQTSIAIDAVLSALAGFCYMVPHPCCVPHAYARGCTYACAWTLTRAYVGACACACAPCHTAREYVAGWTTCCAAYNARCITCFACRCNPRAGEGFSFVLQHRSSLRLLHSLFTLPHRPLS